MNKPLHDKHRQRMREKLLLHGSAAFNDHELLEMLLYNVIPRQNTNPLAHLLINTFGSLDKVLEAPYETLITVEGVGKQIATYILLISSVYKRIQLEKNDGPIVVYNSETAANIILPEFYGVNEEKIFLLALDKNYVLKYKGFLHSGTHDTVEFCVREIINKCVPVNASRYYLAHNHPSGLATPSESDARSSILTENILTPMNMLMEDHFIIADNDYVSLRESKMLLRQMTMNQAKGIILG